MHVPPSSGSPEEPEIIVGPADEPRQSRKSRKPRRRSGLAIAVFSVLAAALLGGGAVFAYVNAGGDDPRVPAVPDSAQEAVQEPEPDQSSPQDEKQKPKKSADVASGGDDTSTGGGGSNTGGGGSNANANTGGTGGNEPAAGRPAEDKPSKQRQSSPQKPQGTQEGDLSDGPAGYVHPQGPVGGY
ncbi:hypothetical protein [Streptosporangium sp. NPDC049046]|uniref:hypothetical protein n=1 Tax=Streptosporangium sp. NPDC049046 TaxID=3155031 RepID=UPI00343867A0